MSLKSCKECGKEVSNNAEKCPHCGAPIKKKGFSCLGTVFLIIIALIAIGSFVGHNSNTDSTVTNNSEIPSQNPSVQTPPPQAKLEIVKGWEWVVDGNWTHIQGSVKNTGDVPISYFKVRAEYKNAKGEVIDTAFTNSGERINPGASKKFEIMHKDSPDFKTVSLIIEKIRN